MYDVRSYVQLSIQIETEASVPCWKK